MKRFFSAVFAVVFLVTSAVLVSPITALANEITHYANFQGQPYNFADAPPNNVIDGVYQGLDKDKDSGMNFAPSSAPPANIIIREEDIDNDASRNRAVLRIKTNNPCFKQTTFRGMTNLLEFDNEEAAKSPSLKLKRGNGTGDDPQNLNKFDGPIATYTYENVATYYNPDGTVEPCNVVFTYSNLVISVQQDHGKPENSIDGSHFYLFCANMIIVGGTGHDPKIGDANDNLHRRYGIEVDVTVQVLRQDGTDIDNGSLVEDYFYFRAADIDINRDGRFAEMANAKNKRNYSESITLVDGFVRVDNQYDVFIPGQPDPNNPGFPGDSNDNLYKYKVNNTEYEELRKGYKCEIIKDGTQYTFNPTCGDYIKDSNGKLNDRGSFYSGFMCVVNNSNGGLKLTARSAGSTYRKVETYLFADYTGIRPDTKVTRYQLMASSGPGGEINGSGLVTVDAGSTISYTMTPSLGWKIKTVYVKDGDLNYRTGTVLDINDPASGIIKNPDGSYTFTFSNINMNHAIHVEWETESPQIDVEVNKSWEGDTETDRPNELKFTLNANGTPIQTITIKPDPTGVWKGGFSNLPVKDDANKPIVYSITEYVPTGYTCSHNEAQLTSKSATFINTKAPTPTVSDPNAPQTIYTIELPIDPIAYEEPEPSGGGGGDYVAPYVPPTPVELDIDRPESLVAIDAPQTEDRDVRPLHTWAGVMAVTAGSAVFLARKRARLRRR